MMLNNREISERFEVQINTLYNWQKTKPKLFKYLQNADYNSTRNEEINILLNQYLISHINGQFSVSQIKYIIDSSLNLVSIEDVQNFHKLFIQFEYKKIPTNIDLITDIYDKLKMMNIIDKYIFYKKIYKFRIDKLDTEENIKLYFKEFIQ